jgi:hypothetical protein
MPFLLYSATVLLCWFTGQLFLGIVFSVALDIILYCLLSSERFVEIFLKI